MISFSLQDLDIITKEENELNFLIKKKNWRLQSLNKMPRDRTIKNLFSRQQRQQQREQPQ
jgi:hypothetical protein